MNVNTIFTNFRSDLLSQSAVSGFAGARVFASVVPQGETVPAITLTPRGGHRDSFYAGSQSLATLIIQVGIYSNQMADIIPVFDAIEARYEGFNGTLNANSEAYVQLITLTNMITTPQRENDKIIGTVFDVEIMY